MSNTLTIPNQSSISVEATLFTVNNNTVQNKRPSIVTKAITKVKAHRQANKIIHALNEVKKIEAGRKTAKSFDQFLKEF